MMAHRVSLRQMEPIIEILGWVGSLEVLIAYGLNSYQKLRSNSVAFYVLNLTGSVLLIIYTVHKTAFASAFINICWALIALAALGKVFFRRKGQQ